MLNIVTQVLLWENEKDLEVKNFRKKKSKKCINVSSPNGTEEKKNVNFT